MEFSLTATLLRAGGSGNGDGDGNGDGRGGKGKLLLLGPLQKQSLPRVTDMEVCTFSIPGGGPLTTSVFACLYTRGFIKDPPRENTHAHKHANNRAHPCLCPYR